MNQLLRQTRTGWALVALAALVVTPAFGVEVEHGSRNFDARIERNAANAVGPDLFQVQALNRLQREIPDLGYELDNNTGVTRTLYNQTGFLTGDKAGAPMDIAMEWVGRNAEALGLSASDLQNFEVTDSVLSNVSGATHIYLRQLHQGIPVYNGQLNVNVSRHGRILSVNNDFLPQLSSAVNAVGPRLGPADAVAHGAKHLGFSLGKIELGEVRPGAQRATIVHTRGLSQEPIVARLFWLPVQAGDARLVWNFQIYTPDSEHYYDLNVDALDGKVWTRFDWVNDSSYRVYERPCENPNDCGRTLVSNPEDGTASPNGWFNSGVTRMEGPNVHAYEDRDSNNSPPSTGAQPTCPGENCDFPINLGQSPQNYIPAAVANLFYWNNIIHDTQYRHGFDVAAGNFQGVDSVRAEAQDGSGTCNANFSTPPGNSRPRMQMFICGNASPARDGDLDNPVIVHEYGHGISIRQVGGPNNSSCLNNSQQGGEGWSDWFGLVYTARSSDTGPQARGIGQYLFGQANSGPGIRDQPYSTSGSVNTWTYESISGAGIPHGVGSRWAQALWEVYWALVDKHGFDTTLNTPSGSGNSRALLYVNEGLKSTACSPTFTQARDGIIQAATNNFNGEDVCDIWEAFAAFGLGTDAVSGGSNSTNPTNGFAVPSTCDGNPPPPPPPGDSCVGFCGGQSDDGCWCDDQCEGFGDCCPDKQEVCDAPPPPPPADSCVGFCGGQSADGCWCDNACASFGDCCPDKVPVCG